MTLDTFLSETFPTCANCCYILCFNVIYIHKCLFLFIVDYCHHPTSAQIDDSPSTNGDTTFIWTSSTVFTCLCQDSEVVRVQRMCRQHSVTIYCTTRDVENESFIRMKQEHHKISARRKTKFEKLLIFCIKRFDSFIFYSTKNHILHT